MKKFLCTFILITLVMGMFVYAQAADVVSNSKVKCNLNSSSIVIDNKPLNMRTLTYNNKVYVPLNEISGYLKSSIQVDEKTKTINIVTTKASTPANLPKTKPVKKMNQTIVAGINQYNILVDGLKEYIESIVYNKTIYVPIRYYAEIFDRKIDPKADGRILISNKTGVVSVVNGDKVLKWEYDYFYNAEVKRIEGNDTAEVDKQKEALKKELLEYVADLKIISQKVTENKISLDSKDISSLNTTIDSVVNGNGGIEKFRKLLSDNDLYFHHIVLKLKEETLNNKLLYKLIEPIAASEDELKKYYDDNSANFATPEMVRAKHILILTRDEEGNKFDDQKKNEAKAKAEEILSKIKNGGNFDELMKANSQDPGLQSEPNGYTFPRGQMVKEFEDAAFSMNVGDVSDIVETDYGYHIIKLEEKIPSKISTFEEVKASIKQQLDNQKKQDYANGLLKTWKSESKIENKI